MSVPMVELVGRGVRAAGMQGSLKTQPQVRRGFFQARALSDGSVMSNRTGQTRGYRLFGWRAVLDSPPPHPKTTARL